jgi:hypothetical protein
MSDDDERIAVQFSSSQMKALEQAIKYQTISNILLVSFGVAFVMFLVAMIYQVDANNFLSRIAIALERMAG